MADFIQNFVFVESVAGFGIVDFRVGDSGVIGFVPRCGGNGVDAGDSSAAVTGSLITVVVSSFVIFSVAVKPFVHFDRQGVLNLLSLHGVESSTDSVAGKVFDKPFASFGGSRDPARAAALAICC